MAKQRKVDVVCSCGWKGKRAAGWKSFFVADVMPCPRCNQQKVQTISRGLKPRGLLR